MPNVCKFSWGYLQIPVKMSVQIFMGVPPDPRAFPIQISRSTPAWKALIKTITHESFRDSSLELPSFTIVVQSPLPQYGGPSNILYDFHQDLYLARKSNIRICFLLHATSLASHTSCFRPSTDHDRSPLCQLCAQDIEHFLVHCPIMSPIRVLWLPRIYSSTLPSLM